MSRGRRGTDWNRVRSNESTCEGACRVGQGDEVATENGGRMAHGDLQPARPPSRAQQSLIFIWSLLRDSIHCLLLFFVVLADIFVFVPLAEIRNVRGEDGAIVDTSLYDGGVWFDCSFFIAFLPRVVTLTAIQTAGRRVPICAPNY